MHSFVKYLVLLWVAVFPLIAHADIDGEIYSLDPKTSKLTVTSKHGMATMRVRAGTVITVNGVEAKFDDLNLGMTVKVVSAEPEVATEIKAFGVPSSVKPGTAHPTNGKTLSDQLSNSHWRLPDGKEFVLRADGTTTSSWHKRIGTWKIIDDHAIELMVWHNAPALEKATVNPDATSMRWSVGGRMATRFPE